MLVCEFCKTNRTIYSDGILISMGKGMFSFLKENKFPGYGFLDIFSCQNDVRYSKNITNEVNWLFWLTHSLSLSQ